MDLDRKFMRRILSRACTTEPCKPVPPYYRKHAKFTYVYELECGHKVTQCAQIAGGRKNAERKKQMICEWCREEFANGGSIRKEKEGNKAAEG